MTPAVSVIIPAYNEGADVVSVLTRVGSAVTLRCEIVVVVDSPDDSTIPFVEQVAAEDSRMRVIINTYGRGPANAIRFGIDRALAPVVVVTMADGCDDPHQIDMLTRLVDRGVVVAAASRYARSGQQVGGPFLKGLISRMAGLTLFYFARVGTRDATNSFKAYSKSFIEKVGIESDQGFEIGIELVSKARRYRQPVAEIPTIWLDRAFGTSNFKLVAWLPRYIRWYFYAFGAKKQLV
jgi:cellulose synthase/poly-beta-1,6-N-acetylglucosamine synthase-like glycosyltransferase